MGGRSCPPVRALSPVLEEKNPVGAARNPRVDRPLRRQKTTWCLIPAPHVYILHAPRLFRSLFRLSSFLVHCRRVTASFVVLLYGLAISSQTQTHKLLGSLSLSCHRERRAVIYEDLAGQ